MNKEEKACQMKKKSDNQKHDLNKKLDKQVKTIRTI